jgi:enoyl-CoA hydratase
MDYNTITYEKLGRIGYLTLNRPDKLNAINDEMLRELDDVLRGSEYDIDVKVLVIKGAGPAFCSGEDLSGGNSELMFPDPSSKLSAKEQMDTATRWNYRWEGLFNYLKPTVAQVHGQCLGRVTGLPIWTWFIGIKRAKEILYLGNSISAKEAEEIGLITKAVPAAKLEEETNKYVEALNMCPGDGMVVAKESINACLEARGVGAAWRFLPEMQTINLLQHRVMGFGPGEFNFWEIRDEKGLEAALEERDAPFKKIFPAP